MVKPYSEAKKIFEENGYDIINDNLNGGEDNSEIYLGCLWTANSSEAIGEIIGLYAKKDVPTNEIDFSPFTQDATMVTDFDNKIIDFPRTEVTAGVLSDECTALMQDFFRSKR